MDTSGVTYTSLCKWAREGKKQRGICRRHSQCILEVQSGLLAASIILAGESVFVWHRALALVLCGLHDRLGHSKITPLFICFSLWSLSHVSPDDREVHCPLIAKESCRVR